MFVHQHHLADMRVLLRGHQSIDPPQEVVSAVTALAIGNSMTHVLCTSSSGEVHTTWTVVGLLASGHLVHVAATADIPGWHAHTSSSAGQLDIKIEATCHVIANLVSIRLAHVQALPPSASDEWTAINTRWRIHFNDGDAISIPANRYPTDEELTAAEAIIAALIGVAPVGPTPSGS